MALIDFIEVRGDIIDLSTDEETTEEDHSPTPHRQTLQDRQASFMVAGEQTQDGQNMFSFDSGERQEASESGNAVEAIASSLVMEKGPLDTATLHDRAHSPPAAPFPGLTSTNPKALTVEGCDAKLLRVKVRRTRKNYHTDTPRRSPRIEAKRNGCRKSIEELALDRKRSYMLDEPEDEPTTSAHNVESAEELAVFSV